MLVDDEFTSTGTASSEPSQAACEEEGGDGHTWRIEVATRQWERQEIPTDAIKEGDVLDVVVWPARDGSPEGVLSAFTNDGVYTLIHEEV